jgi:heavy metal efflux system protein
LHRSDDERSWRKKWWERLRRNVTREEQRELTDIV